MKDTPKGINLKYKLTKFAYVNVDSGIIATNVEDRLTTALEKAADLLKVLSTQR